MTIAKVAVVGAGNMGSGIAQKFATELVPVVLVDTSPEKAAAGLQRIEKLLMQGLERRLFTSEQVDAILGRITATSDLSQLGDVDLVVEAVFEDLQVKRDLFKRLADVVKPRTILATNTSSFLVQDLAEVTPHPERVVGLHYFYHPAKNRLVEVIGHPGSDPAVVRAAWLFQERVGKTPIASADAPGFVVNRFFVPWLNEAVRLHEEGLSIATIEKVAKATFGVGMGPFELMNVTGVPITLHAATALAERLGDFYAPSPAVSLQVANGSPWDLEGEADLTRGEEVADRLCGVVFHVALQLVSEGVGTLSDVDIGARVGLRWPTGPFELMNAFGLQKTAALCEAIQKRYGLSRPARLEEQLQAKAPFPLRRVNLEVQEGIGWITINRPDQLNALDPITVQHLGECFDQALADPQVKSIVIAGAGKAFVAGADVKWFVDKMRSGRVDEIVTFASEGQDLFKRISESPKRVVAWVDGMALGGGAELALACHVIVASPRASMGFPETGIGIYPGLGGTQRLTARLGKGLSRYLLYTGQSLSAEQMREMQLAWRVVEADQLDATLAEAVGSAPVQERISKVPESLSLVAGFLSSVPVEGLVDGSLTLPGGEVTLDVARRIRRKAPNALAAVAELTELAETGALKEGLAKETQGLSAIFSHPNALEGMGALLEGRKPKFGGM